MSIPAYQELYRDMLKTLSDGKSRSMSELRAALGDKFGIDEEQRKQLLPSGSQRLWDSRVGWAKTYLVKGGLLAQPKRGIVEITERGKQVLKEDPPVLDDKYLVRFPEFKEFATPTSRNGEGEEFVPEPIELDQTPEELIESAYQKMRRQIESELHERIMTCSPKFFEQLVVDLLLAMGYGGSRSDAGRAIGQSGDGGIDGIIKEDRLGLDTLYLQAKRWTGTVGRPEVQRFAGALHGQRANRGVMLSTGTFTREAHEYVGQVETRIILIDGNLLTQLMFEHGLGCSSQSTYDVKRIDSDYFEAEMEIG